MSEEHSWNNAFSISKMPSLFHQIYSLCEQMLHGTQVITRYAYRRYLSKRFEIICLNDTVWGHYLFGCQQAAIKLTCSVSSSLPLSQTALPSDSRANGSTTLGNGDKTSSLGPTEWVACGNVCSNVACGNVCSNVACENVYSNVVCENVCFNVACENVCFNVACENVCSNAACENVCSNVACENIYSNVACENVCSNVACENVYSNVACENVYSNVVCENVCSNVA